MLRVTLLLIVFLLVHCTPTPSRPSDFSGTHKQVYDACERSYAACLQGGHSNMMPGAQPLNDKSGRDPSLMDPTYGFKTDCDKRLQRCYNEEASRPASR